MIVVRPVAVVNGKLRTVQATDNHSRNANTVGAPPWWKPANAAIAKKRASKPFACIWMASTFVALGRILGVNHQSVANWVKAHHEHLHEAATDFPNANRATSAMATQITDEKHATASLDVAKAMRYSPSLGRKKACLHPDASRRATRAIPDASRRRHALS